MNGRMRTAFLDYTHGDHDEALSHLADYATRLRELVSALRPADDDDLPVATLDLLIQARFAEPPGLSLDPL